MEKKLEGYYTRMLWTILYPPCKQHHIKQRLDGYLPPITKTIQFRRTKHVGPCWRSWEELKRDVLRCTTSHGGAKAGCSVRIYIEQRFVDTRCSLENLPEAMDDREGWRERARDTHADGATWWWYIYIYIYIYISCRAASTDIPDPLSPRLPIVHRLWQVFRATSCIHT